MDSCLVSLADNLNLISNTDQQICFKGSICRITIGILNMYLQLASLMTHPKFNLSSPRPAKTIPLVILLWVGKG